MYPESTTIYYTINGADPRQIGGTLAPGAQSYVGGTVSTITFVTDGPPVPPGGISTMAPIRARPGVSPDLWTASWKGPARGQFGYGEGDETSVVEDNPTTGYNAADSNRYLTTYFRTTFTGWLP